MSDTSTTKLKKILELTNSDNDNEALLAMRHANKILKDEGKTWSDIFHEADFWRHHYNVTSTKYNELVSWIKMQQAFAVRSILQVSMPRRRRR